MRAATSSKARADRPARLGQIALIGAAVLCTIAGLSLMALRLRDSPSALSAEATVDSLAVAVRDAGWVAMDAHTMDSQGGFQMPAQMMPGAPAGDEMRLGITLTLENTGDGTREFNLSQEFSLMGGVAGGPVALHSDTFGRLSRLGPGSAVNGVLYFDTTVPAATDPPLVLRWIRDGHTVNLSIPLAGSHGTPHTHAS